MNQTKLESLLEMGVSVASGFIISILLLQFVITPIWGLQTSIFDNLGIVIIFTVATLIRGYIWRRFFNAGIHKVIHNYIKDI